MSVYGDSCIAADIRSDGNTECSCIAAETWNHEFTELGTNGVQEKDI